ncbi:MAG: hypothetical protein IKU19_01330, partial [Clostridia bacterium]|nr:hypothetical protein [Clostridia bacterium]
MKKKIWIPIAAVIAILAVLFVPIPKGTYDDGGTREYVALTYKIVRWNKILSKENRYTKTRVYFGADRNEDIDELWDKEYTGSVQQPSDDPVNTNDDPVNTDGENSFLAVVIEYNGSYAVVEPLEGEAERNSCSRISFSVGGFEDEDIEPCVGDTVRVTYTGGIMETYPAQINAVSWEYYSPEPYFDDPNGDEIVDEKPVIYLYPEEETEVSVKLKLDGELTCTYPKYKNGWNVTAHPDGTLTDREGQIYNYLYWEGRTNAEYDLSNGFCVKGEDTAAFLEKALEELGINRREANEFIVYWLPLMECNPYNIISFQTDIYTESAELIIDPVPDTLIRVFMAWQGSDKFVSIPAQELT